MERANATADKPVKVVGSGKHVDVPLILDAATAMLEVGGIGGFSMRRLADRLGVAVTSIYWHVGGRDKLFDRLIDRLTDEMSSLPADGNTPIESIAALARAQRKALIDRQHLLVIAHERDRTPSLFQPVQQILAGRLAELGITGEQAALALRSVEVHVISSALMQFSSIRSGEHDEEDASLWGSDWPDRELVDALRSPTDYDAVFEYGLSALLVSLQAAKPVPD
jgi:TetR/AcrR family transcriptional regulator, tetracycline repressor protein